MNYRNFGLGSNASKGVWLKPIRTFTAKSLLRLGSRCADLAEWIAPWIAEEQ